MMNTGKSAVILSLCLSMVLGGCCSIFRDGSQVITIDSKPQGAKVRVGEYGGVTPYQVAIPKGKDYVIMAKHMGKEQTQALNRKIDGVYWINILFWPGLIIDAATSKMFVYDPVSYSFDFTGPAKN